jgi:septal ring factor EnvC (AmiA/AmiB activator)
MICFACLLVIMVWQSATSLSQKTAELPKQQKASNAPNTSTMLAQVKSLIQWVSDITPILQSQGNEADRNKLRDKLGSISRQLASTETINTAVVENLKSANPDYNTLRSQLLQLQAADASIAASIAAIRSELHLNGQAETELERAASDAISAKGMGVDAMLNTLQYPYPQSREELHALQTKSDELKALLRQADDAITKAYSALQH